MIYFYSAKYLFNKKYYIVDEKYYYDLLTFENYPGGIGFIKKHSRNNNYWSLLGPYVI